MLASDQAKFIGFHKTLITLEETTQSAIEFLLQQLRQCPPYYKELARAVRLFKNMMITMEENIRMAMPTMQHINARRHLTHCLTVFQSKQDLRHYAVASMSEAIESQSLCDSLIRRYEDTFKEADQLSVKIKVVLISICEILDVAPTLLIG